MEIARFTHVSTERYQADAPQDAMPLESIPLPCRATSGSAGYDFTCTVDTILPPGGQATFPTGVRCEIQPGWVMLIFPRSSLGIKHRIRLANSVGVIDSDYAWSANEGHMFISLVNDGSEPFAFHKGDRVAQGVLVPFGTAGDHPQETRNGGFGSTGK